VKLVTDWWQIPDFSHGFLVPLFSAYLIWQKRKALHGTKIAPSWGGIAVMALGIVVLFLGVYGSELFLSRISLLILLAGLVLCFGGWQLLKELRFALLVLLLAIPLPAILFNQITFPLQILASKLASGLLPLFGVPVLREGNIIELPAMRLEVAEACSGIRSLMSLFTLSVFYGYFMEKSVWRRTLLVLASIPIAIAANAVRILGTGLCVQYWDPDKAMGFFHEFSGWVIFLISLVCLYCVQRAMSLFPARAKPQLLYPETKVSSRRNQQGTATFVDFIRLHLLWFRSKRRQDMKNLRFWTAVLLLAGTALLLHTRPNTDRNPPSERLSQLPAIIEGWTGNDQPIDQETRDVLGAGDFLSRIYTQGPRVSPISLFIGYFPTQRTGQTIHSPKHCLPGAGWTFESSDYVDLADAKGKPHRVGEYIITNNDTRQFVIYWYQAHGRSEANEYMAKMYLVADAMRMNRTDGALIRVITPIGPQEDLPAAKKRAEAFTMQLAPLLPAFIPD